MHGLSFCDTEVIVDFSDVPGSIRPSGVPDGTRHGVLISVVDYLVNGLFQNFVIP